MANKRIPELDPVVTAAQSDKFIVRQSGDVEDKHVDMDVMQLALQITESQITDLQSYLLVEANDLTAAVVWADIPDANVPESAVTQHEAALSITESQISDLQAYLLAELNDLTAAVVWANVPDLNITESSVTQHEAALSITESQISDLQAYLLAELNDLTAAVVWADVPDTNITESSVTQHEAALTITESQISDLQAYLLAELNDLTAAVVWANIPDGNVPESAVTQHEAALSITESQISDLSHTIGVSGLGIWKYRTETGTPPATGQIRFNNANISLATEFYLSETNEGGVDVSTFLELLLQDGSALFIQDQTDAANFVLIEISSSVDSGTFRTYGIANVIEEGTEPGQNDDVVLITTGLASAGGVVEVNDLTAAVTWADIPDTNVPESAVTQHEAALTITESQISDLQAYLLAELNDLTAAVVWANVPDGNITESSVTQHEAAIDHDALANFLASEHFTQAAISITESQISDLGAYLENILEDTTPQLGADLDTNGFNITNLDTTLLGLLIAAGSDGSGNGGTLTLRAGASGGSSSKGGSVAIEATNGAGGGAEGGDITLTAGNASGSGDDGGDFLAMGGNGVGGGGNGGTATIEAGRSVGGGIGGIAAVVGGVGGNGANTGGIGRVIGGFGGDNGGDGGDAEVTGGAGVSAGSDGDGGDAVIRGGAGAGAGVDGDVVLAVVGATDILFDHATGRLEQGAETYAYQSELAGAEANDLTAAVVWANIPDGNVPESAVTQHEAALTILESQITDGTIYTRRAGAETISNNWNWLDNAGLNFGTGNDWSFLFNGADLQLLCTPTTSAFSIFQGANIKWELDHDADRMWLRDGYTFRISSSDDTDFAEFSHDLTDFLTAFTTTVDWNITGLSGRILQGAETLAFVSEIPTVVVNDVVQARRTTDLILTTSYVDVTLDTTDVESDAAEIEHDAVTDRVVVKTTGLYEIGYEVDVETTETSGSLLITADGRVRVNDTGVDVPGSIAQAGSFRDTSLDGEHFNNHLSNSFFVNLTANDFVTLQLRKTELSGAGSGQFEAVRTTLKVKRLQ